MTHLRLKCDMNSKLFHMPIIPVLIILLLIAAVLIRDFIADLTRPTQMGRKSFYVGLLG